MKQDYDTLIDQLRTEYPATYAFTDIQHPARAAADAIEELLRDALRYRWLARKVSAHKLTTTWQFGFPTALTLPASELAMSNPEVALGQCIDAALEKHGVKS
jgi:hypothetical protein